MTTAQQLEIRQLIREILGDSYTHLRVRRVKIVEDLEQEKTSFTCEATDEISKANFDISGEGVGVIDAFFHALSERFSAEYPSLRTIRFHSFSVQGQMETKQKEAGSDSEGEVTLEIVNSDDKVFSFSHSSRSVLGSAIIVTLLGLEYFINAERAFISTYHALKDARERSRPDLVQHYTETLSMLVKNTSYSEVIHKIREEL